MGAVADTEIAKNGTLIECEVRGNFAQWLCGFGGTIVVSTYQAGKVAMLSWDGQRCCALFRQFDKPTGMAVREKTLAVATREAVTILENVPELASGYPGEPDAHDAIYLPRQQVFTGDLLAHDLAFGDDALYLVNTRFNCLAKLSSSFSFDPCWKPRFISDLVPDDRCHLNGLAMLKGRPKYVTALGECDSSGSWRESKVTGGILMDVDSNEIVKRGMAMPHSPRLHDGKLWLLNSGAGELWRVDPKTYQHDVVCQCQGYLRGLALVNNFAIVGLCQIRERSTFGGMPIKERYANLLCGIAVIDLCSGAQIGMVEFTGGCQEIYGVDVAPGYNCPMILNAESCETGLAIVIPGQARWMPSTKQREDEKKERLKHG